MIDKDLHLRRKKDNVEVITLQKEELSAKSAQRYTAGMRNFVPVRYIRSGRKGYLKGDVLEADFVVIGKADPSLRWAKRPPVDGVDSAAALEDLRERDIKIVKRRVLDRVELPEPFRGKVLGDLKPSPAAHVALEQAIHMILSGGQ